MRIASSVLLRVVLPAAAVSALSVSSTPAPTAVEDLTVCVDVPSTLGGVDYLPGQVVAADASGYALAFDGLMEGLPPGSVLDGLSVLEDGSFLFSVDVPVAVGPLTFGPADVIRYDPSAPPGGRFSLNASPFPGALPAGANVDAIARDAGGALLVSFDAPVTIGVQTFLPADVVRLSAAGGSLHLSGASLGLGPAVNVTGFDQIGPGDFHFTFDTPVGAFLPGDIVRHGPGGFSTYFHDPLFPAGSAMTDFSFPPSPGEVPDGHGVPGIPLTVTKGPGPVQIRLDWGLACNASGTDFAVYEGKLGAWYSHSPRLCSTAGATFAELVPAAAGSYYLVVPRNELFEGSYGRDSSGLERPFGPGACLPRRLASPTCP